MRKKRWFAASGIFMFLGLTAPAHGEVRVAGGVRFHIGRTPRIVAGFHYGPRRPGYVYHAPYFYAPRRVEVYRINYGEVDFNVEPQNSRIFVDGRYLGIADDFNGWPQTAKLPAGYHDVEVVAPDGRREQRRVYVAAGQELNFNLDFRR